MTVGLDKIRNEYDIEGILRPGKVVEKIVRNGLNALKLRVMEKLRPRRLVK